MAKNEQTSKTGASKAGQVMNDPKTAKADKGAGVSGFAQNKDKPKNKK
jgi:hypothetical protein